MTILFLIFSALANFTLTRQIDFNATTTSQRLLLQDSQRKYLHIQNRGSHPVDLKFDSAHLANEGIRLKPEERWEPPISPINEMWIKSEQDVVNVHVFEGR